MDPQSLKVSVIRLPLDLMDPQSLKVSVINKTSSCWLSIDNFDTGTYYGLLFGSEMIEGES